MKTFKDTENREWIIAANIATVKRVRDLAEVDLTDPQAITALGDDPLQFGAVLYALCQEQIEKRSLDETTFWSGFDGDTIDVAARALVEELVTFSRPDRRTVLRQAIAKRQVLDQKAIRAAQQIVQSDRLDRAVENRLQEMNRRIDRLADSGPTSTQWPESSATTSAD